MLSKLIRYGISQCRLSQPIQGIDLIEFNKPESKNALSQQLLDEFEEIIHKISKDQQSRACILRSSTPNMFCSGADLKQRLQMSENDVELFVINLRKVFNKFYNIPVPTIAAIDGYALGGGLELALCADIRIATQKAQLGLPETGLAIIPGAGGTQTLQKIVGVAKAKELIFTGQRLTAQEALDINMINYVENDYDSSYDKAVQLSEIISKKGPIAIRAAKKAINMGQDNNIEKGLQIEELCYSKVCYSQDRVTALEGFVNKQKVTFKNH